jgi:hypothetical protein
LRLKTFDASFLNVLIRNLPVNSNAAHNDLIASLKSNNQYKIEEAEKKINRALEDDLIDIYARYKY